MTNKEINKKEFSFVFDFGGVIFDWSPYYLFDRIFGSREAADRFLKEIDFASWNVQQDMGYSFEKAVAEKTAEFPHYKDAIRAYNEEWMVMYGGRVEGTIEVLADLKAAGYPLLALSNWSVVKFNEVRAGQKFLDWFDHIVLSGEEGIAKPDERLFRILLERAGRRAEDCIFIDDVEKNITAARALGFRTILFESPEQLRRELVGSGFLN